MIQVCLGFIQLPMCYNNEYDQQWGKHLFGETFSVKFVFSLPKMMISIEAQNANGLRELNDKKRLSINGLFCGN